MPRLRDTRTDVVVDVDDVTAAALGAAYEPVVENSGPFGNPRRAPAKKAAPTKSDTK